MKHKIALVLLILLPFCVFAQQTEIPPKYALVIGNGQYRNLSPLANPVNDADDMALALQHLGFSVEKVLNGTLEQMEKAVAKLRDKLKDSTEAYGFFFYAGHGVQSNGENYLIPVNTNIPSENYLRERALSVQVILDDLNDAGNSLNVIVLDACRDNPFNWSRGTSRGLAMISRQPADSIIVYATSAGQQASDGEGRNGLFTSQLLPNLVTPGLEVNEIFRRTGLDVSRLSSNRQIPAIYSQFFRRAYLGTAPDETEVVTATTPLPWQQNGAARKKIDANDSRLWTLGASIGSSFSRPLLIGTVRGTIAPFNHSFLEIGFDAGVFSEVAEIKYFSLYPYLHYAYYLPFAEKLGWYIGGGSGYLYGSYEYPEGPATVGYFTANIISGFNILNLLDVSYTLMTNFEGVTNKLSLGYTYRFLN